MDMCEFQLHVDDDEYGIYQDHTTKGGGKNVDEHLEVMDTYRYDFLGFYKDERKRMLREFSVSNKCSGGGEIHKKAFKEGQVFKKKYI